MKRSRILIADDVAMNREMLSQMLGDGYDFVYAQNGVEVVDILRGDENIDLILLDLNMPQMDGFEVLKVMNERHWIEEFPVIIISAEDGSEFIAQAYRLGVVDYISRPFRTIVVQRRVENTLMMYAHQKKLIQLVENQVYDREKVNNSMINIFSNIIELRNHESGSHTLNVQIITKLLLQRLVQITDKYNLTKTDIALISSLSALHDIGKIKVPDAILNKPGKLTADEWEVMKSHTVEGDNILQSVGLDQNSAFIRTARHICRWHHEKYDGNGYPDGLVGDNIPIEAQVVSVADAYDALTSVRCYKNAYPHSVAKKMIIQGDCGKFNPLLMQCLNDISNELQNLKDTGETYDFQREAAYITDELLIDNDLPQGNALRRMMDNERKKKDFFMECCDGIQFEYDVLLHKASFVYSKKGEGPMHKVVFTTRESPDNILPIAYWDMLRLALHQTTREDPIAAIPVKLRINGKLIPYQARAMAIWPEDGSEYIFVVGHFTKKR